MRVLVTGGAGFIGHHLVAGLVDRGHDVVVLDDFSTGQRARVEAYLPTVRLVEGSILDPEGLASAIVEAEVVFHQAAIPSVARSLADPLRSDAVNVVGTMQVMLAAARAGVRRVVLAGSSSVYGVPTHLPCDESMRPRPASPYGVSKLAAEAYLHAMGSYLDVETVSLRYFNVFGPGQDPASEYAAVVPRFVTAILAGRGPTINGSGDISRDFTYVDNVIAANLLAAESTAPSGGTYNIACGKRTSLLDLLAMINQATGRDVQPVFGPARTGDIVHSQADITAAREALGYRPEVAVREGLERTVQWFAERHAGDAT